MKNQHFCQAAVLHCIDFRIQRYLNDYLEERFSGSYDRIAVAGGVKNLPLDQCEVSVRLHSTKIIVLIQHEDCGAYGGSKELGNLEAEQAFQKEEMRKAEKVLTITFSDIIVERFFMLLSGEMVSMQ